MSELKDKELKNGKTGRGVSELTRLLCCKKAMKWYRSLDINTRINAKTYFKMLCGMRWEEAGKLFSMRERIGIMYDKLLKEGFAV